MSDFFAAVPWLAMLIVFVGMAVLLWRSLSSQHETIKLLAQLLGQSGPRPLETLSPLPLPAQPRAPVTLPSIFPLPSLPQHLQPPAAAPALAKPAAASTGAPPWYQWALHEIGFHETGNNQGIERYIGLAHCGALGDPWCAIFVNAALESSGIPGTRSASSQSFRHHPDFVQLSGPALGAIAIFWRGSKDSGLGHAAEYGGEDATHVWSLGGNENDMVQIEALPKSSATFGLIGYWWPKSVPLPAIGPVLMPAGSAAHVQTPPVDAGMTPAVAPAATAKQTDIVATMFGGQASAYGGAIDDNANGVALPFHFTGSRPQVRVTSKRSGQSIVCDIVDVGPWNTHDAYWQTGSRPQAETGTDMSGRNTNRAGIDLTFAAAKALQIDGKGLVDWEFVQSPLAEPSIPPKVT